MIIDFHTHKPKTAEDILAIRSFCISEISDNAPITIPHSIGLHPWNQPPQDWIDKLYERANNPNCILIGECGLDKLRGAPIEIQLQRFKQHVEIAEQVGKPMVIHCVKGFNELIELHKTLNPKQSWVVHGFRGNLQLAQQLIAHNIYVSIGMAILNAHADKLIETIKGVGIGNFLLETDMSETPIKHLYQSVAEIVGCSIEELSSNINNLFVSLQKI